jgi:hypothetical protein
MNDNHIDLNFRLRVLMRSKDFYLTSITSRECLEDTYSQHLHATGLAKRLKYRLILWLMYTKLI